MEINEEVEEFKEHCVNLSSEEKINLCDGYLYALIRRTEPEVIVENTGIGGASTFIMLKALQKNGHGKLYTFDPTNSKELKGVNEEELEEYWEYVPQNLHKSEDKLKELMGEINIFYHDSRSNGDLFSDFRLMSKYVAYDGKYVTSKEVSEKVLGQFELLRALHNDKNQVIMNGFKVFVD